MTKFMSKHRLLFMTLQRAHWRRTTARFPRRN